MKKQLRSSFWYTKVVGWQSPCVIWANGARENQMGKPIIAIVNSFTPVCSGHVHLHEIRSAGESGN